MNRCEDQLERSVLRLHCSFRTQGDGRAFELSASFCATCVVSRKLVGWLEASDCRSIQPLPATQYQQ
jgi:hypothetical protein